MAISFFIVTLRVHDTSEPDSMVLLTKRFLCRDSGFEEISWHFLTLINTAMGIYGPNFCKGLIDSVWCDNVGSHTHSNSANMLYSTYTKEDMLSLL